MDDLTDRRLSLTEWVVLALVDEEPRHGFSAARELKSTAAIGQIWSVPAPLVYRALDHLELLGLLERLGTEPGEKGPVRTVFRANSPGREQLASWLREPVTHPRDVRTEFIAKLVFTMRRGQPTTELVRAQLEVFAPVAAGLAEKALTTVGPDHVVALWRSENMAAITSFLHTMSQDQIPARGIK
jgi:PadR family transcriptional regulator AphA